MCRTVFKLGPIICGARPFFYLVGIIIGLFICIKINKELKLKLGQTRIILLHIYIGVIAHLGAQLFHYIEFIAMPNNRGRTYYGGVLSVIFLVIIASRWWRFSVYKLFDLTCISGSIGGACLRIGCLLNGCCPGRLANNMFGVKYPFGYIPGESPTLIDLLLGQRWDEYVNLFAYATPPLHPAVLYYFMGFLLIFVFLYARREQIRTNPGNIASMWLLLHGILRFLVEMIRNNPPYLYGRLNLSGILSIVSILVGIVGIIVRLPKYSSSISFGRNVNTDLERTK